MFRFKRKVTIYDSRNEADIKRACDILKQASIETKTWASESMPVGGCGAKMRPSDWSGKKPTFSMQRDMIYRLDVPADDEEKARKLLEANRL